MQIQLFNSFVFDNKIFQKHPNTKKKPRPVCYRETMLLNRLREDAKIWFLNKLKTDNYATI